MSKKSRAFGAIIGAFALSMLFVSTGLAKQDYSITAEKTASVSSLPVGGGTVTWTVAVTNDGTKDFNFTGGTDLVVNDTLAGCDLAFKESSDGSGPEGKGKDGKLAVDATWWFWCNTSITKTTTNCATADASHDASGNHDATSPEVCATVTVGTTTATIDTTGTSAAVLALVLLAIGGLGFLGTTNRLPKLPKFR